MIVGCSDSLNVKENGGNGEEEMFEWGEGIEVERSLQFDNYQELYDKIVSIHQLSIIISYSPFALCCVSVFYFIFSSITVFPS